MSSMPRPAGLTVEELGRHIIALEQLLAERVRQGERLEAVVMVLLARVGDPGRVTVKEAAALEERLFGKGSVASVRSKITAGRYTLEKRPGEKEARIPVEQIYGQDYLPMDVWRRAHAAQKAAPKKGR